ncbi:VOC family protein [Bacillus sp. SJS]|uniref:VOC family protein n=1 Tax=Bacillus sp. SJS TaxID=1423321 RepID=UPI0004DCD313|nr:VOC family protein [Bacillus sp. SJS]KZZ83279.1 hypothetical protein AS29_016105 [Bacillus sp. SJS]
MKAAAVPIKNQMNGVFVHVKNLKASVAWYFDLLGQEADLDKVHSPVCNIPINGTTSLTLDDHSFDAQFKESISGNPIFNLYAPEIEEAYAFVKNKEIKIVRELEWAGETAWFNIQDPDGNVIMIANC